ncbi:DNA alkylation repair protein [Celeribacter marinus]|uniref:DNA alkylation repair enzyme n=1 Tax=Celeribacter marinus TaxID=1397108 RepID=A0A0P0A6R3_9RHOB|nr:DNA alkylation repair protein [Celeribacter marinus]ALI56388.1 DNA alkylation repair enzyme [Celeribacter marinus]SFK44298.1 DNA alkylation repair enzyme [Celeribacter marinus]
MTPQEALTALQSEADATRAADLATRFGAGDYIGVAPARLEEIARQWRQDVAFPDRLELARALWETNTHEARLMAAKLLTQARIKDDADIWAQICTWIEQADTWAQIDALGAAGGRRIAVDLSRMATVHALAASERSLDRRAALILSTPLAKLAHPSKDELNAIDDVLFWLTHALQDADKDVARAADTWVRALGKHDGKRAKMVRRVVELRKSDG